MSVLTFGLLGPLDVVRDGHQIALNTGKLRVVLATLLLRANRTVSVDELVERLWGESAPSGARKTAQLYAMRLRRALGDDSHPRPLVLTRPGGYVIELEASGQLDISRVDQLHGEAKAAAHAGDLVAESALLGKALALWRGRPLDDVPSESLQREVVPKLEETRLLLTGRRLQIGLELGRHQEIIGDLGQLTGEHPWHERFWIQLITALHRSGRLAEALDTCRRMRELFRAELGIDPGEELQQLHRELLAGSVSASAPAAEAPPRAVAGTTPFTASIDQLPPPVRRFVGRARLVEKLTALVVAGPDQDSVPIINVSGPPGIGKTALALHVAHRLGAHFPDGHLYVNLRGYTADPPLPPSAVLIRFLLALGVPLGHIPVEIDEQTALYRSMLAGRRMLVLLDDAAHPDQVRPLLPGRPGCVVLVTSRSDLRGLAATHGVDQLRLSVLSAEDSAEVLAGLIGVERASAEPGAVAALAATCAHLPLALRIAGANLAADPHGSVAGYVEELRESGTLAKLAIDGDERAGVRVAIDSSYDRLNVADRRLFRLLGMSYGLDFTVHAAAAVADLTPAGAASSLDRLTAVNLLHRHAPGRFQMHDLIREYAAQRAETDDPGVATKSALVRLTDFYLHTADQAARRLYPGAPWLPLPAPPNSRPATGLTTEAASLRWLDAERPNLLAAVIRTADWPGHRHNAWRLIDVLRGYVELRGCPVEASAACEAALGAAERDGDHRAQAAVLDINGLISYNRSDYPRAIEYHTRALEQARLADDLDAECHCLNNLGRAYAQLGQPQLAGRRHEEALAASRRAGNREAEALALHGIGTTRLAFGRPVDAIEWHQRALGVYEAIGDRRTGYRALNGLGLASWALGRLDDAAKYLEEALGYCRELGLGPDEAVSLVCLAETNCDAGRFEVAAELAREAIELSLEVGERRIEAGGWEILATVRRRQGRHQEAIEGYAKALRLAKEISITYNEASTLIGLAGAHRGLGDPASGAEMCRQVLDTLSGNGMDILAGAALTELARDQLQLGEFDEAATTIEQALTTAGQRGQRLVHARALCVLGLIHARTGEGDRADTAWRSALEIFTDIGTPEAEEIRECHIEGPDSPQCGIHGFTG
ncbi:tetratricopeptide repeat protein [Amycolatopsis sp. NPDC051128]|uniref:AfsR/SARP family transcriptional regulator n=1 Tax=Amycolatopsis sp. NPDC051128 TaxID=3155412 RepID=UPI00342104C3